MRTEAIVRRLAGWSLMIAFGVLVHPAFGQPGPGPGFGGPRMGGPFGGGGIEILMSPQVGEELELIDEQREQIRGLFDEMRGSMRSLFEGMRDIPEEDRRDYMMQRMQEQQEKMQQNLSEILLDHQLERLKQLQLQTQIQRGGAANALASEEFREKLGLTEDQVQRMQELAREAQEELREKIERATREAQEKVLSGLTPAQRKMWDDMVGDNFDFSRGNPALRGAGGPGRPGALRGGDRNRGEGRRRRN